MAKLGGSSDSERRGKSAPESDPPSATSSSADGWIIRRQEAPRMFPGNLSTVDYAAEAQVEPAGRATVAASSTLGFGSKFGRYTNLKLLGRGGMGTVFEAYDDTLARNVALKVLHGKVDKYRRDRWVREAQALAQLSHPNVVQVYETGVADNQMFIAMELVSGQTLRDWQHQARPWREVVDVYLQAGRGLAAAHAEDLVHRDFKPENCILGDDGRVCVLDFGLVRGTKSFDEPVNAGLPEAARSRPQWSRLTGHGKLIGTPGFIPLRQLQGHPGDAKSDQFGYCASMYEALYGVLPFDADEPIEVQIANQRADMLQPVPTDVRVPRRLRKILLRGLAKDPNDRWNSMGELLAQLERLRRPRWRRLRTIGATLVVGFGAGALAMAVTDDDQCENAEAALENVWGDADREAVRTAYLHSGHVDAPQMLERVTKHLSAYTSQWTTQYEQACRANLVAPRAPETGSTPQMTCLQRHRSRLRATVDALAEISTASEALDRTILPFKLPSPTTCSNSDALEPGGSLPTDPQQRESVLALRKKIDQANTLGDGASFSRAIAIAHEVVEEARVVDHAPSYAEALETLGRLQSMGGSAQESEETLEQAIEEAALAHDDATAARAWTSLIAARVVQGEPDRALSLRLAATAATNRAHDEVARGWLLNNLAMAHGQRSDFEAAHTHLRKSLAVKQRELGADHIDVGIAWFNLGNALRGAEKFDEAHHAFERARAIFEVTVGLSHPYAAFVETGLGHLRRSQGRTADAVAHHRRALEIREQVLGPDDPRVAQTLEHLGLVRQEQGELLEADDNLQRALEINARARGINSALVGLNLLLLAEIKLERAHVPEAQQLAERAVTILEAEGSAGELAEARFMLARTLVSEPEHAARVQTLADLALEQLEGDKRAEVEQWKEAHVTAPGSDRPPAPPRSRPAHAAPDDTP